jgi:hypothetical protein
MSDLKTVLINDSRIEDISGEIGFAVQSGAQQSTYSPQNANTFSNSSHSWQINAPSENIVIDRRMLLDSDVSYDIGVNNVPVGSVAFNWGSTDCFGPYPLTAGYLTQNVVINSCSLSVNTQDVMASLLRMNDQKIHTYYDGWTPSMVDDVYYNYSDGVGATNNPLAGVNVSGYDNKINGRGSHKVSITVVHTPTVGPVDTSLVSTNLGDTWVITVTTHLTEPLLFLSPFISNPCTNNEAGLLGINNITFNFTIDSLLKRVFRTSTPWPKTYALSVVGFSNLRVLINYLSVQPSQYAKISARNVLPLLQYDRYIPNGSNNTSLAPSAQGIYTSSTITLNQVPDTLLIFARKPIGAQTAKDADAFCVINSISVNFNNVAGILASASPQELWNLSVKAGSSQSFLEFQGSCNTSSGGGAGTQTIATIGSLLALQPSYSFNLPDYLSSSSLGSYSLQFSLSLTNQGPVGFIPEIIVISITSGYLVLHQGSAQSFSGVLNKEMVMSAKDSSAVPRLSLSDYDRMVGGVRDNRGVANMMKHFKARRMAKMGDSSMSGSAMSAGVMSAGKLGKYIR